MSAALVPPPVRVWTKFWFGFWFYFCLLYYDLYPIQPDDGFSEFSVLLFSSFRKRFSDRTCRRYGSWLRNFNRTHFSLYNDRPESPCDERWITNGQRMRKRHYTKQQATKTRGRLLRTDDGDGTVVERRRVGGRRVPSLADGPRSFGWRACQAPPPEGVFRSYHSLAASIAAVARPRPLLDTPTEDTLGGCSGGYRLNGENLERKNAHKNALLMRARRLVFERIRFMLDVMTSSSYFFSSEYENTILPHKYIHSTYLIFVHI